MRRFALLVVMALFAVSCHGGSSASSSDPFAGGVSGSGSPTPSTSPTRSEAPSPTASPTQPVLPDAPRPTAGPKAASCVNGWTTPAAGTPQFTDPLGLIRKAAPVNGEFKVVDMRYFVGPESPPSEQGYLLDVERWYIKLYVPSDLSYQGRFLVEQRTFGRGVVAVAPYDTKGFRSPDWTGFQWSEGDRTRRTYPGLPGTWEGVPYDFVKGGEGLTIPGLPDAVAGCLAGT
jgi:hypothetical protein